MEVLSDPLALKGIARILQWRALYRSRILAENEEIGPASRRLSFTPGEGGWTTRPGHRVVREALSLFWRGGGNEVEIDIRQLSTLIAGGCQEALSQPRPDGMDLEPGARN